MPSDPEYPASPQAVEAFAGHLVEVLNHGALCLMLSLGHRTGLFDALRGRPPSTSEAIAAASGLNERYVREWLGAMATAGIVTVEPAGPRFALPPAHATCLTRAAAADNLAVFAQYIAVLGAVEDAIATAFQTGDGVPYERYTRFHEVMAEDSGQSVLSSLESAILPLVPGLTDHLERGIRVLDVGCGSGRIINHLAGRYPRSEFTGLDLSPQAIARARAEAKAEGLDNVVFIEADAAEMGHRLEARSFELITTFDAIHDQADPQGVLRGIHRALVPEGIYLMQDIRGSGQIQGDLDHPLAPFLYTVSCMHCMPVSLARGGPGLGAMWGEPLARDYLQRAGFRDIRVHQLAHDLQNNWYVATR
ncbi:MULTISPECIES: methyltransferase domain-containing protein [unclassified Thioalkalivibrio]|uniref:methyltransferase domain-containing protein n=1 Tax=unclassified Thioalkalivibrio TaxID=2621013 RepID=UPI00039FBCA0|nr:MULTISPECIES: methyltransferase domain-containing protein [unclassified Thioalkalivibrio]